MIEPETRRHFERAIELVTAARARDGQLMVEIMTGEDLAGCAGAAIAAAVIARDSFDALCAALGRDAGEYWADYALECQQKFDREQPL